MTQLPLGATLVSPVSAATTPRGFKNPMQPVRILDSHRDVSERHARNVDRRRESVILKDHAIRVRDESCLAMGGALHQPLPGRHSRSKPQRYKTWKTLREIFSIR
jgi:hypothetical protein